MQYSDSQELIHVNYPYICQPALWYLQDDGHIFCLPDQIAAEIQGVLDMVEFMMGAFGFSKLEINLSTRPAKAVGSDEIWEKAEGALKQALQAKVVLCMLHVALADTQCCIWLMEV